MKICSELHDKKYLQDFGFGPPAAFSQYSKLCILIKVSLWMLPKYSKKNSNLDSKCIYNK